MGLEEGVCQIKISQGISIGKGFMLSHWKITLRIENRAHSIMETAKICHSERSGKDNLVHLRTLNFKLNNQAMQQVTMV